MPRKKRFFRQKRVYGKRKTPAINSPVRSFVVAIPLHHYKDSEIQTVNSLRERTIATNSFPLDGLIFLERMMSLSCAMLIKEEMVAALSNFREDTESEEICTQSDEMDWVTMCDRGGFIM